MNTITMFHCETCGAFLTKAPSRSFPHKHWEKCSGAGTITAGLLLAKDPISVAVLSILGWDHYSQAWKVINPPACTEKSEVHKPHRYLESVLYWVERTCRKCGTKNGWWSLWK